MIPFILCCLTNTMSEMTIPQINEFIITNKANINQLKLELCNDKATFALLEAEVIELKSMLDDLKETEQKKIEKQKRYEAASSKPGFQRLPCYFVTKYGKCTKKDCGYDHTIVSGASEDAKTNESATTSDQSYKYKTVPCKFGVKCLKGNKCPFIHASDNITMMTGNVVSKE